jgi:hypothetical protein
MQTGMNTTPEAEVKGGDGPSEYIWGVAAIAREINRTPRQTFHLLSKGALTSVKKIGGRYIATRSALRRELGAAS